MKTLISKETRMGFTAYPELQPICARIKIEFPQK
jgi:hypothetical protein